MANPALIAKVAATVLADEKARKAVGWVLVAIFSPVILLIAFLCSLGSGASSHNASAVEVCFNGAAIPPNTPLEYRVCLEKMRSSLALVDTVANTINLQIEEGTSLDTVRVKAIFFALYFGAGNHGDTQTFVDCFITYEDRIRMVPVAGSNPPAQTQEKYTVAVPITDMGTVWQNIQASMGVIPTAEQRANADSVYVITHCAPTSVIQAIDQEYQLDTLTDFLETVNKKLDFQHWLLGHYHDNRSLTAKHMLLWKQMIQII